MMRSVSPILILIALTILLSAGGTAAQAPPDTSGNSMLLSNIYVWKGDALLHQGLVDDATESYLKASHYMRTSPDPHFALARVYLRRSLIDSFLEFATGLKLTITGFFHQSIVASNLLIILLVSIGAAIYTAVIIIIVRHAKSLWLSVMISLPDVLKGKYPQVIGLAAVLAFFVLISGLSIIGIATWAIVVGCGLVWRFASQPEKRTIVGFAIFLVATALTMTFTGAMLSTQHPKSPLRLAALADRIGDRNLQRAFSSERRESRYDPIAEFMQGFLYLRSGQNALAIERFNHASKLTPNSAAIYNNLGVAHHKMGRYRQAETEFQKALRFGPRESLVHYNYSQTLNAMLRYDQAEQELAKASALDFELTRSLMTQSENTGPVPMNLQTRVLWLLAMSGDNRLVEFSYHPVESGIGGGLLLILIAGLGLVFMRRAKCPARCEICATTVQTQLTRRKRRDVLCPRCLEIKIRNANDHRELEMELERRLGRMQKRDTILRVIAGLVVPGSTYHLAGKRFKGFAVSAVMFALLALALYDGALINVVPRLRIDPVAGWALPVFIVAYAVYAWRSTVTAMKSVEET